MIAYSILKTGTVYQELGGDYFDQLHPDRTARRLVRRLERLGLQVTLAPSANPTPIPGRIALLTLSAIS